MKKLITSVALTGMALTLVACDNAADVKDAVSDVAETAMEAVTTTSTLNAVKERGVLSCGVSTGLAGFSQKDETGAWSGLDVDVCRGVAAAVSYS